MENKEQISLDEFKGWLAGLIRGKGGALPNLDDWKLIKELMDKVVPDIEKEFVHIPQNSNNPFNVPYDFNKPYTQPMWDLGGSDLTLTPGSAPMWGYDGATSNAVNCSANDTTITTGTVTSADVYDPLSLKEDYYFTQTAESSANSNSLSNAINEMEQCNEHKTLNRTVMFKTPIILEDE